MPLQPGQTAEVQQVVTRELTADVLGNRGVTVFATPFVLTLLENAAHYSPPDTPIEIPNLK